MLLAMAVFVLWSAALPLVENPTLTICGSGLNAIVGFVYGVNRLYRCGDAHWGGADAYPVGGVLWVCLFVLLGILGFARLCLKPCSWA